MSKINRSTFIKNSLKTGALVMLTPLSHGLLGQPAQQDISSFADDILERFVKANDKQIAALLKTDFNNTPFSRRLGHYFTTLTASYCAPQSVYFRHASIIPAL